MAGVRSGAGSVVFLVCFRGRGETSDSAIHTLKVTSSLSRDTAQDSVLVALTADEFRNAGFRYGDRLDITFVGSSLNAVPFYDDCRDLNGSPVLIASPGSQNLRIFLNTEFFEAASLENGDPVTLSLNRREAAAG